MKRSTSAYERPAPHACLPYDELVNTDRGLLPIGEVVEAVQAGFRLSTFDRFGHPTPIVAGVCNGFDWAIPAVVLSVPGLLLILVLLAQVTVGLVWLPLVRRRLGEFGFGRRRRRERMSR